MMPFLYSKRVGGRNKVVYLSFLFSFFFLLGGARVGVVLNMVSLKYRLDIYVEMLMKWLNLTLWDSDEGIRLEIYM